MEGGTTCLHGRTHHIISRLAVTCEIQKKQVEHEHLETLRMGSPTSKLFHREIYLNIHLYVHIAATAAELKDLGL